MPRGKEMLLGRIDYYKLVIFKLLLAYMAEPEIAWNWTHLPVSTALAAPSNSDSGLSHVTCFGQWDSSKGDVSIVLEKTCELQLNSCSLCDPEPSH